MSSSRFPSYPVGEHRDVAVRVHPDHTAVAVLADREEPAGGKRQPVRFRVGGNARRRYPRSRSSSRNTLSDALAFRR